MGVTGAISLPVSPFHPPRAMDAETFFGSTKYNTLSKKISQSCPEPLFCFLLSSFPRCSQMFSCITLTTAFQLSEKVECNLAEPKAAYFFMFCQHLANVLFHAKDSRGR